MNSHGQGKALRMNDAVPDKANRDVWTFTLVAGSLALLLSFGTILFGPYTYLFAWVAFVVLFALSLRLESCVLGFIFLLPCIPRVFYTPAIILPVGLDFGRAYFPFFFLALAIHFAARRPGRLLPTNSYKWLFIWIALSFLAFARALNHKEALLQRLIPFMAAVTLYLLFLIYAREKRNVENVFRALIAASIVVFIFAIVEILLGENPFWDAEHIREGHSRLVSTMENTQVLGTFLVTCLPMIGYFFLRSRRRPFRRITLGCMLFAYLMIILFTFTRSSWLACLMIGLLLVRGRRSLIAFATVMVLIYVSPIFAEYILPVLQSREAMGNVFHRLYVFRKAIAIIGDSPVLGVGLDNFVHYSLEYDKQFLEIKRYLHNPGSHNTYLTFAAEQGLMSFAAIALFILSALKAVYPMYKEPGKFGDVGLLGKTLFISTCAMLVTGLTYQAFQWATLIPLLFILLGSCHVAGHIAQQNIRGDAGCQRLEVE